MTTQTSTFRITGTFRGERVYVEQRTDLNYRTITTLHDNPADTTPLTERSARRVVDRLTRANEGADPWDALTDLRIEPAHR